MRVTIFQLQDLVAREHRIEGMKAALTHVRNFEDRAFLSFRIKVAKRELAKLYKARKP